MPDNDDRQQHILNAAAAVITRLGYDKTTMSDIATEAGLSRGTVYLYYTGKQELFEALLYYEVRQYAQNWLEHIEANPRGGTIGGLYKAFLYAINSRPFMAAMLRRDQRIIGSYLRRPGNLFAAMQSGAVRVNLFEELQKAGAIRPDVDPQVMSYILDVIGYGLLTAHEFKSPDEAPPFDAVIETIADMMDRLLTPEDGGDSEAGKTVIRQLGPALWAQIDQTVEIAKSRRS